MKISETRRDQLIELDERLEEPAVPWRYWLGGLGRELGGNAEERTGALDGGPPGGPAPEPASALRRRITVQFDDTPLEEAVAFFRELLGVAITIDRSVGRAARETPVKLKAVDCEFGPALARMCAALGLAHRIDGKTVVIFRRKGPARAAPGR